MAGIFQLFHCCYQTHKNRIRRLSAELGWIVVGQVASVTGTLVLLRVLTEYLNSEQYGQLALGLTLASLVNQTVLGGIANGISRFYSVAAEKQDVGAYLRDTRYLLARATAVVVAIGLLAIASLYWLSWFQWIGLAAATLVFSLLSGYNSAVSGIQNAARQRIVVAFHGGLDAWLKIPLSVGVLLWLGASSTAVVIGHACSSLLITVSQLFFLRRTISEQSAPTTDRQPWASQIWAYSLPFSIWGIFTWMQQVSDRWALQVFASISDVGQYAVLFQLGYSPIILVSGVAVSFLAPIMYQRSGDATDPARNANVHRLGWHLCLIAVMVTLLGVVFTFALHEQIFRLLVAAEYHGSSYLLPWMVLAGGIFAAGQMLALKLMSEVKPSRMMMAKIVTSIVGVLLNVFCAALAGVRGVVGALVIYSLIYLVWMAILSRRLTVTP